MASDRLRRGVVGLLAAGAALGAQWAFRLAVPSAPFAPFSVGDWLIRRLPGDLATAAIERLGHNAVRLLEAGAVLAALALGVVLAAQPPILLGAVAFSLALAAAFLEPTRPQLTTALSSAAVAGLAAWAVASQLAGTGREARDEFSAGRRKLIAGAIWGAGALLLAGSAVVRTARRLPAFVIRVDRPAVVPVDPAFPEPVSLSSAVTSRSRHYTVDINLSKPFIDRGSWRLEVDGLVGQPLSLSLDDLLAMTTVEQLTLMCCISNEVGGSLVGDAKWTGIPLVTLLEQARPPPAATEILISAADGYTETMPLDLALRPDILVAFGMNGLSLPVEHGFPARMLIPGRYGMKGPKWLRRLTVIDREEEGYWERRGWDGRVLMRTSSRFDLPEGGARLHSPFVAAGVAWAGDRRVQAVEVSTDDGQSWRLAQLEVELGDLAWRRWQITLHLAPGLYPLTVRAVDGTGEIQDPTRREPHPAGSSGYHRITVSVVRGDS